MLSLNSVTELGQSVRRSVSLRSHRSQLSGGSSNAFGHQPRASSGAPFQSSLIASPVESVGDDGAAPPPLHPVQTSPPCVPRSRGKPSISSKFSSQSLTTIAPTVSLGSTLERPTTGSELRKTQTSSSTTSTATRRVPSGRPPVPPLPSTHITEPGTLMGSSYLHGSATPATQTSSVDPKVVYRQIHEICGKRMATIDYLRKVHEGNIFYFSTLHYSPAALQTLPSMHPSKLGRRATNFFVLGYSLPALLDLNATGTALDYLRSLNALLQEFETYQTLMGIDINGNSLGRGRVQNMFKLGARSKGARRTSTTTDSIFLPPSSNNEHLNVNKSPTSAGGGSGSDIPSPLETSSPISPVALGHDFQHLVTPHLPFDPDFTTIYATLCDTMTDTYAKVIDLIASPEVCTASVGEAFGKVDKALRKILVTNVTRELEESGRANVRSEVAGLGRLVLGGLM